MFSGFMSRWIIPAAWAVARRRRDLACGIQRVDQVDLTSIDPFPQGFTLDVFCCYEVQIFLVADLVHRQDARMVQRRSRRGFLLKPPHSPLVLRKMTGKEFQSNRTAQPRVASKVDFSHSPNSKRAQNLVMRYGTADQPLGLRHAEELGGGFRWKSIDKATGL